MLQKLLLLAAAGALGTLARFALGGLVHRWAPNGFPWGTLAVNIAGCFLFGIIWAFASGHTSMSPETRTIILVGFMGAFTTFSSFVFDTHGLIQNSQYLAAAGNILLQNTAGIALFFVGVIVGKLF